MFRRFVAEIFVLLLFSRFFFKGQPLYFFYGCSLPRKEAAGAGVRPLNSEGPTS